MIRIGHGYDVHRFSEEGNRPLVLCGVKIPGGTSLAGHSDADVAVHAVCDALLGSLALSDIGKHFPPTGEGSEKFKNINSMILLETVMQMIEEKEYNVQNIDITIIAEKPKLSPFIYEMRDNIARTIKTSIENVSVKATTEEGLGLSGKGIGAHCVVIMSK